MNKQIPLQPAQQEKPMAARKGSFLLRLYIGGISPKSVLASENIRAICAKYLLGCHKLEIIDIFQQPHLAKEAQIVAVPTLVKVEPLPQRRFIGDLSHTDRVLTGLGLLRGLAET